MAFSEVEEFPSDDEVLGDGGSETPKKRYIF